MSLRHEPSDPGSDTRRIARVLVAIAAVAIVPTLVIVGIAAHMPQPDATLASTGGSIFASPKGTRNGDGSLFKPVDLATALSADGPARPGTTVWIRGGSYRGAFKSDLTGTEADPIIVRPYPGEHVVIDSAPSVDPALLINGAWATYVGLEVTSSSLIRRSQQVGNSQPTDMQRGPGVEIHGPHVNVVNFVVHEMISGFGVWSDAVDSQVYGNLIYNNGWVSADRNNGHGVYTQNQDGVRHVTDNIIFNQFAIGIHAYGSDQAFLDHISLEGNVAFNNGTLAGRYDRNILLGGGRVAVAPAVLGNYTYYSTNNGLKNGENNLGYLAGCVGLDARDNYFFAGDFGFSLEMVDCSGTVAHNVFIGELRSVRGSTLIGHDTVKATYPDNTYLDRPPSDTEVFVRPNRFERGRAHVIVFNWAHASQVDVDLRAANLPHGERFEVRDAENYFGPPVARGIYDGAPVRLNMTGLTVAKPVGDVVQMPIHTAPEFGVFIVVPSP